MLNTYLASYSEGTDLFQEFWFLNSPSLMLSGSSYLISATEQGFSLPTSVTSGPLRSGWGRRHLLSLLALSGLSVSEEYLGHTDCVSHVLSPRSDQWYRLTVDVTMTGPVTRGYRWPVGLLMSLILVFLEPLAASQCCQHNPGQRINTALCLSLQN